MRNLGCLFSRSFLENKCTLTPFILTPFIPFIHNAGVTSGANMTMTVTGRAVCGYCKGHVPAMAEAAGLNSLTVFEAVTGRTLYWEAGKRVFKVIP